MAGACKKKQYIGLSSLLPLSRFYTKTPTPPCNSPRKTGISLSLSVSHSTSLSHSSALSPFRSEERRVVRECSSDVCSSDLTPRPPPHPVTHPAKQASLSLSLSLIPPLSLTLQLCLP